jgi:hypothetical protein
MKQMDLNEIIVNAVLKNIPKNIKPVSYLMDLLELSRESVYRRMRKEIPFSMEELARLSLDLGFSIDEIIEGNRNERVFFDLQSNMSICSSDSYSMMFQSYDNYLHILLNARQTKVLMALNQIPALFLAYFNGLFQFSYYKWHCETSENASKRYFSDLVIPSELYSLKEKVVNETKNVNDIQIILSPYIFLDTIKEIQYYYHRKLLKNEELIQLKNDMLNLINLVEKIAQSGGFGTDAKTDLYLSSLYLTSNTVLLNYDDTTETHLWMYMTNPMIIRNTEVCEMQKKWLQSLKKHSTLITQSNEILQAEFFDKQREYVESFLMGNTSANFVV